MVDELTPKDQRESFLVKEVVLLTWDPTAGLFADSASSHQAVEMKMGLKLLIPSMQNSHKSQFSAKLLFTELCQCLGDGFKEDAEHQGFVLQDEGIQLMRQGENNMEVGNGKEF